MFFSLFMSNGASTPRSLNCGARSRVGWQRSKPSPPVACSLLICSSFCENGVWLTLMPVAFSKFGITGSGNSSDQMSRLSSPEDEKASFTIHGPVASTAPAAAALRSMVRRLKALAAISVSVEDDAGFFPVIRLLPVLRHKCQAECPFRRAARQAAAGFLVIATGRCQTNDGFVNDPRVFSVGSPGFFPAGLGSVGRLVTVKPIPVPPTRPIVVALQRPKARPAPPSLDSTAAADAACSQRQDAASPTATWSGEEARHETECALRPA